MKKICIITPAETQTGHLPHLAILSERGVFQASQTITTLEATFDLVVHAPIPGASQTAHIIAGVESAMSQEVRELCYDPSNEDGAQIAAAKRLLGAPASLREYFQRDLERPLRASAETAHGALANLVEARKARFTLAVADPLIAPLLAMNIAGNHHLLGRFITRTLGPCQGYMLTATNGRGFCSVTEID